MSWLPAAAGRLLLIAAVAAALFGPSAATLWISTPDASDVQARVAAITRAYGVPLLGEDDVPSQLALAVVAIEDERFYSHHGVDSIGLARAILYDAVNFCLCEGGSTITQQLVKDVYLGGSNLGRHKIEGMALALKVERILSKARIMADYLSEIPTGINRNGVTAAACAYFRAPLKGLTLGQYALLAGVTQAPSQYDPTVYPDVAAERRSEVLQAMQNDHYISAAQAQAANAEPVLDRGPGRPGC
ncbi:MAG TPA: biosynthetic peptidoglycan transglycosylase [Candidatus Dormibacteraeota bacterium]|nr:biosynthetic peptidoglycan transglycosylase [Candidatus Dormibacteraeota bacterium]